MFLSSFAILPLDSHLKINIGDNFVPSATIHSIAVIRTLSWLWVLIFTVFELILEIVLVLVILKILEFHPYSLFKTVLNNFVHDKLHLILWIWSFFSRKFSGGSWQIWGHERKVRWFLTNNLLHHLRRAFIILFFSSSLRFQALTITSHEVTANPIFLFINIHPSTSSSISSFSVFFQNA